MYNIFVSDLDVYYDEDGLYLCDVSGEVHWIDLSAPSPLTAGFTSEHLPSTLHIQELSVDWLSNKLYIITNNALVSDIHVMKLYQC